MATMLRRLKYFLLNRRRDRELAEEIEYHRSLTRTRLERDGMAPHDAEIASRRMMGNVTLAREDARGVWFWSGVQGMLQDVRYGSRTLLQSPGFAVVALVTIALGIGGNTAVFSVVNAVTLRPLPYAEPDRLAMLWIEDQKRGLHEERASSLLVNDWRQNSRLFASMAMYTGNSAVLEGETPERTQTTFVSADFFSLLGVPPVLGRVLTEEDERGASLVALISHSLWQRRFGGAPDAIGRTLVIAGDANSSKKGPRTVRIVGVMPPDFAMPSKATQVWEPATVYWRWKSESVLRFSSNSRRWAVIGRLKPGVTPREAQTEMSAIGQRLAAAHPVTDSDFPGFGINVVPLLNQVVGSNLQFALWILLGAVGCVLMIGCANVANLQLARGTTRAREFAVRVALGAGRARLVRQMLIENLLLSSIGGLLGIWLAATAVHALSTSLVPGIPRLDELTVDSRVLVFATVLSLASGLMFGLFPAWRASSGDAHQTMKEGAHGVSGGRSLRRARDGLIVAECALAVVLLAASGLFVRSFLRLQAIDPGFDPNQVLLVKVSLAPGIRPQVRPVGDTGAVMFALREELFDQISTRIASIGGVRSVGATTSLLNPGTADDVITMEGADRRVNGGAAGQLAVADVSPTFFQTMGVPLVRGRFFTRADAFDRIRLFFPSSNAPLVNPSTRRRAAEAAIVNEAFVARYFGDEDPLGRRFYYGEPAGKQYWFEIVGVVRNMRRQGLEQQPIPEHFGQLIGGDTEIVVRTDSDPVRLAGPVRDAIHSVDSRIMILNVVPAEEQLGALTAPRRFQTWVLGLFAAVALGLAAVGIYGVVRYTVAQRTREIGVRAALGADRVALVRMVTCEGLRLPLVGMIAGLAGSLIATRLLRHMLFEVEATDPITFLAAGSLLVAVTLMACYLPARRAARVDPVTALRCD
jgi:putative ABC transport system permease protein